MNRPDSISAVGLEAHLDSTRAQHKDKGYSDFLELVENKASQNYMARCFGVTKNTISKWLLVFQREKEKINEHSL